LLYNARSELIRGLYALMCRHKLRVLDAFGTEAIYNDVEYVRLHPELEYKAGWGRLGLRLKQFYTLYRMHSILSLLFFSSLFPD